MNEWQREATKNFAGRPIHAVVGALIAIVGCLLFRPTSEQLTGVLVVSAIVFAVVLVIFVGSILALVILLRRDRAKQLKDAEFILRVAGSYLTEEENNTEVKS